MTLIRNLGFIVFLLIFQISLTGQATITQFEDLGKKEKRQFKKAKKEAFQGNIKEADKLYNKVLKKYPDMQEAFLNLGGIYQQQKNYTKSEEYFKRALELSPRSYPLIQFQLGVIHKQQKNYALAAKYFDEFLSLEKTDKKRVKRAKRYAEDMHFADQAIKNPVDFNPQKLSSAINSIYSEYTPVLRGDGQELIFTRRSRNQEDFYSSKKDSNGVFQTAEAIDVLNTPGNEGAHTLSSDGNYMVFTACDRRDGYGLCDLYYSKKVDGEWTKPNNLGKRVNSAASDTEPSLTSDGSGLYFSSNRKGSIGGSDIWFTKRRADGKWYIPVNLGATINTIRNEESPFIHQDGVSLYFRSNGFPGMGAYDIYKSEWSEKKWSTPENLGYPINTEGSEGALTISLDGAWAFYATDIEDIREGNRKDLDIYRFEVPAQIRPKQVTFVSGQISDGLTGRPIEAKIKVTGDGSTETVKEVFADSKGGYFLALPLGYKYSFVVEEEDYLFHSEHFELDSLYSSIDPFKINISLQALPKETSPADLEEYKPIILNNIFFETGSAKLLDKSKAEIMRLSEVLIQEEGSRMMIIGHTDDVGSEQANKKLSEDRASAVREAIAEMGVSKDRLDVLGEGESKPIADNSTPEGRKKNRRTEFVFIRSK